MASWRNLFGPSKEEVWSQLCSEINARYVDGGFWKGDMVQATHGPWTITLDTYVVSTGKSAVTYTRMRAPFVSPDGFEFTVYDKGIFSDIGKWFGMQDIEVGDGVFDEDFIVKSNNESKVRELLANFKIRQLIGQQPEIHFSAKDDELLFRVVGVIKDVERLKLLYELFSETLDELCRIGSARQTAPDGV